MKNQKGITLIALVITIIVLLILAGVSIAMLTGDNGLLTRAKNTNAINSVGTGKDKVGLAASEGLANYYEKIYASGSTATATTTTIKAEVEAAIATSAQPESTDKWKLDTANTQVVSTESADIYSTYTVNDNGTVTWVDHFSK